MILLRLLQRIAIHCVIGFTIASCGSSNSGFADSEDSGAPSNANLNGDQLPSGDNDGGGKPAACAAVNEQATSRPLSLYIMFDKSSSQVGTKWESAKAGLNAFLNDSASAGIRTAINFFPRPIDSTPVCDQNAYKTPRVPFGALPGQATAIMAAISGETPNGTDTPIYPALGGAILGAISEVSTRPGESAAVLLITDGEPTGPAATCGGVNPEDPAAIAKLAQSGVQFTPAVPTYVIGLPGVQASIAHQIAAAGGSKKAFIVSNANVQAEFQKALSDVRGNALPCEYDLPAKLADKTYAYDKVNVGFTPNGHPTETIPQSPGCSGEGWRYDNPSAPTKIMLCDATCARVKTDFGAKLEILLGCNTIIR